MVVDQPFMIKEASLFDAVSPELRNGWSLIVDSGSLEWIGPADSAPAFEGLVIDGTGCTVLPGLVDCHVHLTNDGAADFLGQVRGDSVQRATIRAARSATALLDHGITTVRDCGAANSTSIEVAKAIEDGLLPGPRVVPAGRVITMTGGHGYFFGREADGVDGVRAATRAEIKAGAAFIKAMATGGVLTPGVTPHQTALLQEELEVIVREAHNAGRRVASHAIGNAGIKNALRAGVDSIEHGFYLDDEALTLATESGTYLVPTLVAVEGIVENGEEGGIPSWVVDKARSESGHHLESFVAAIKSGMKIAAGTDAGTPFNPHGQLAHELELMVGAGLTPAQALLTATRNAAENLALLHRLGTLEVGKDGDVILVRGNPIDDITAIKDVRFVARRGMIWRNDTADVGVGTGLTVGTR